MIKKSLKYLFNQFKTKMKVIVLPKATFDKMMKDNGIDDNNVELYDDVFFISINNTHTEEEYNKPYFSGNKKNVLIQFFDDVEQDLMVTKKVGDEIHKTLISKAFTREQANELINFLEIQKAAGRKKCIIHCSAGISRSGAVGIFVTDFFGGSYNKFRKNNPHVRENGHVLRLLNNTFRKYYDEE